MDATDALTILDLNLHVAVLAPGRVPRVLEEPVLFASALLFTPSCNQNSVVEVVTTRAIVKDTVPVELELHVVGVNADSKGLVSECRLHLSDI